MAVAIITESFTLFGRNIERLLCCALYIAGKIFYYFSNQIYRSHTNNVFVPFPKTGTYQHSFSSMTFVKIGITCLVI